jgi:CBS domain-containing protein
MIGSPEEEIMTDAPVQHPAPPPATVADVMQPPVTTIEQNDHVAAAAYVMKRANASALIVTQAQTGQPIGIITDADVSRAVADGNNPNDVRIYELMTANPTVVNTTTSIRDAAEIMTSRRFRHLPVVRDGGLVGIVDITDVCRALLESGALPGRRRGNRPRGRTPRRLRAHGAARGRRADHFGPGANPAR